MANISKNIVGIIHARGGSKRIPLKNIKPLNGIPLIGYTIKAALGSRLLKRVVVSSDHPEIIRISKELGAEVPFVRPPDLAEDVASELVTQHAVKFLENETGSKIDIAVTMQPTTPFITGEDIDSCIQMLIDNPSLGSVFSARTIRERPEWMFKFEKSKTIFFMGQKIQGETGVSQSLPDLFIPNGGVYVTNREILFSKNVIISDQNGAYVMGHERSIDIDEPIDFLFAEFLAKEIFL